MGSNLRSFRKEAARCSWLPVGAVATVLTLGLGCAPRVSSLNVPLAYRPTTSLSPNRAAAIPNAASVALYIYVTDSRPDQQVLGANTEEQTPVPVRAEGSASAFVREALMREFRNAGFTVVDTPDAATRILT